VEVHALLSVMKPISASSAQFRLQQLREVMGGHGYSKFNMMGNIRNTNDINNTWEGDNHVLTQQTSKFILDQFKNKMKGKQISFKVSFKNIN
jgi:acyl-CoA oxidase